MISKIIIIIIIIFITYTPGTNKHTHEKNKIFIIKKLKKTKKTHTLTIYNKPNLHRIQIENEYYTTYETHSKSMNVKQSE